MLILIITITPQKEVKIAFVFNRNNELIKEWNSITEIKNLLITYNILFYYHNEDIKFIDYYLDNLKTMFNNLSITNNTDIQFIINFIVSDLDNFIVNLESHININIHLLENNKKLIFT
jgi:hypothetical protein